jgi:hypothetical protein
MKQEETETILASKCKPQNEVLIGYRRRFRGAVFETGAPRTVIGQVEAELYSAQNGVQMNTKPSRQSKTFRFGKTVGKSKGIMTILIPIGEECTTLQAYILPLDIPLLIGLDVIRQHRLVLSPAENTITHQPTGYKMRCLRSESHLVFSW